MSYTLNFLIIRFRLILSRTNLISTPKNYRYLFFFRLEAFIMIIKTIINKLKHTVEAPAVIVELIKPVK